MVDRPDENTESGSDAAESTAENLEVGYCKPPRHTQFKPGQSGNPRGRPKRKSTYLEQFRKVMERPVRHVDGGRVRRASTAQALFMRLRHDSLKGDKVAMRIVIDLLKIAEGHETAAASETDLFAEDAILLEKFLADREKPTEGEK